MNYKNLFLSFTLIIILCGCQDSNKAGKINFREITDIDTLFVNKSEEFTYSLMPKWQTKVLNDTSYLIISATNGEGLQLLIIDNYTFDYRDVINIPQYGPNGFKTNSPSFYWHNSDSVFVFPTSLNKAFLYNRNSELTQVYEYESEATMSFDANEQQQGGELLNSILYINTVPHSNPNNLQFTSNTYVTHTLNLKSNEFRVWSGYPRKYENRILPTSFLGGQIIRAFDSLLLINNYHSDSIEFFNINSRSFGKISTGMTGLNHLEGLKKPIDNRGLNSLIMQLKYPNYYKTLFNPYSNFVYRFSRHLNPIYDNYSDGEILNELENNNSKLLQNTLIVIGPKMDKRYYQLPFDIEFAFPSKDGLIVQISSLELEDKDVYLKLSLN
ncbi:hypothetical protein AWN68_16265 [Roseivirga echinicomitans]|uniref:DUF4221 domain-containing protein n=2 Tax=Roseivirga echinicomitans TaxID=296218 RepID=A0A150XSV7_9BACT|nr:hypothetical protein AWN68_16265 [Roseivirga echinicomitans]